MFATFNQYFVHLKDQRTNHLPLINSSASTILLLVIGYLLLVKKLIPFLVKDRQPLPIRRLIFIYNITMVAINGYFFVFAVRHLNYGKKLIDFKYPDQDDYSKETQSFIFFCYLYWLSKFADWLDTIFFALRKKQSHISFLHLYHHSMVPVFGWLVLRLNPLMPASLLFGVVNCFIHTVMYSYYALSSFGPAIQKYLWWKRYITQMQIIQFVIYIVYALLLMVYQVGYPMFWLFFALTQPPIFLLMFVNFYLKSYHSKNKKCE